MDRGDARFVVDALESRIAGSREELDDLANGSAVRLMAAASRLKGLGADWPPALIAALELETIIRYGGKVADGPVPPDVQLFVDKLRELIAEPAIAAPRNRFERRRACAIQLPREQRIAGRVH